MLTKPETILSAFRNHRSVLRTRLIAGMILIVGLAWSVRADHLPYKLQARGRPETRLAGVDLRRARLADVIKVHGKPTRVKAWEQDNPNVANSYDYYWEKGSTNLKVVVVRTAHLEYINLVEVKGPKSERKIAGTGAGLKLGDSAKDLRRIYGSRFRARNIPSLRIRDVIIQWQREEYSLIATLDRRDRIKSLSLSTPE